MAGVRRHHRSRLRVVADDVELMSPRGTFESSDGGAQATDPAHEPVRNRGRETELYAKSFARGGSQQTSAQSVYAAPAPASRQQTPPSANVYDEDIHFQYLCRPRSAADAHRNASHPRGAFKPNGRSARNRVKTNPPRLQAATGLSLLAYLILNLFAA